MKIRKAYIKVALKFMPKKELEQMAKLSEEQFIKKVRNNKRTKDFPEETIKMMYNEMVKRVDKK